MPSAPSMYPRDPLSFHARRRLLQPAMQEESGKSMAVRLVPCGVEGLILRDVVKNGDRDLVLYIEEKEMGTVQHYLVSSAVLRNASSYFRVLLDPFKFNEGVSFDLKLRKLLEKHGHIESIPPESLPRIKISDFGQLPAKVKLEAAVTSFLCILHDPQWPCKFPGLKCLATVAIIADHFDTSDLVTNYISRSHWGKELSAIHVYDGWERKQEISTRQLLLIGLLLKIEFPKFKHHSANLIIKGSERWKTGAENWDTEALWWNLPSNLEGRTCSLGGRIICGINSYTEELMCRREYLLDTIGSAQTHFLKLYTFQPNQCRLGYDTSPACNSFQLGEAIRFFARKGTLSLENTIFPTEQTVPWDGDVKELMALLRQCPSYQIDSNHKHCGPRNKFIIALDMIKPFPEIGVCFRCWLKDPHKESWLESPAGGKWSINLWKPGPRAEPQVCRFHRKAKAIFTAEDRDWTATT